MCPKGTYWRVVHPTPMCEMRVAESPHGVRTCLADAHWDSGYCHNSRVGKPRCGPPRPTLPATPCPSLPHCTPAAVCSCPGRRASAIRCAAWNRPYHHAAVPTVRGICRTAVESCPSTSTAATAANHTRPATRVQCRRSCTSRTTAGRLRPLVIIGCLAWLCCCHRECRQQPVDKLAL